MSRFKQSVSDSNGHVYKWRHSSVERAQPTQRNMYTKSMLRQTHQYVHRKATAQAPHDWKRECTSTSLLSLEHTKARVTTEIKHETKCLGVAVPEKQQQELLSSSALSKCFILWLMTADANYFLLFVMQWQSSLKDPPYTHTQGSSLIGRPISRLQTHRARLIPLAHLHLVFRATLLLLGLGNDFREKTGRWYLRGKIQEEYYE